MNDDILFMICDCENRAHKMTDWETKFIRDLKARITKNVTKTQVERLDKIWEKVTK